MNTQVKPERDPKVLADLIASVTVDDTEPKPTVDPALVRELRKQIEADRPSHHDLETVDFQRLDADNDWTEV